MPDEDLEPIDTDYESTFVQIWGKCKKCGQPSFVNRREMCCECTLKCAVPTHQPSLEETTKPEPSKDGEVGARVGNDTGQGAPLIAQAQKPSDPGVETLCPKCSKPFEERMWVNDEEFLWHCTFCDIFVGMDGKTTETPKTPGNIVMNNVKPPDKKKRSLLDGMARSGPIPSAVSGTAKSGPIPSPLPKKRGRPKGSKSKAKTTVVSQETVVQKIAGKDTVVQKTEYKITTPARGLSISYTGPVDKWFFDEGRKAWVVKDRLGRVVRQSKDKPPEA